MCKTLSFPRHTFLFRRRNTPTLRRQEIPKKKKKKVFGYVQLSQCWPFQEGGWVHSCMQAGTLVEYSFSLAMCAAYDYCLFVRISTKTGLFCAWKRSPWWSEVCSVAPVATPNSDVTECYLYITATRVRRRLVSSSWTYEMKNIYVFIDSGFEMDRRYNVQIF